MKNTLKLIFINILICSFYSCKSAKVDVDPFSKIDSYSPDITEHDSLTKIDLVYQAVIKHEILELGNSFLVVDKSKGNCSSENVETPVHFEENNNEVTWNKALFKTLNYLNGDVVYNYLENDFKSYRALRNKHGKNGWFEISSPCFSTNDEYALIKVDFGRNMAFSNSNHYLLKKVKSGYKIIKLFSN